MANDSPKLPLGDQQSGTDPALDLILPSKRMEEPGCLSCPASRLAATFA